jgi:hypothetical protein
LETEFTTENAEKCSGERSTEHRHQNDPCDHKYDACKYNKHTEPELAISGSGIQISLAKERSFILRIKRPAALRAAILGEIGKIVLARQATHGRIVRRWRAAGRGAERGATPLCIAMK